MFAEMTEEQVGKLRHVIITKPRQKYLDYYYRLLVNSDDGMLLC